MKTFVFLIVFVLLSAINSTAQMPAIEPGVSQKLAEWRSEKYSDVRYKLDITLEKGAPTMKGTVEIRVNLPLKEWSANKEENAGSSFQMLKSVPTIILDWRKIKGKENLSTISNVSANGRFLTLNPDNTKINFITDFREEGNYFEFNEHLVFQDGIKTGENIIKLEFTSPIAARGAAITRYIDKTDGAEYVYSLFAPSGASTAFPVFDQPDLKAKFSLSVAMPYGWKAVSNEKPVSFFTGDGDFSSVAFKETEPISPYVFAFAAGGFAEFEDKNEGGLFEATVF